MTPHQADIEHLSWLILGGCPRSGTMMMQTLINSHPQIRLTTELSLFRTLEHLKSAFIREVEFLQWQERAKSHKETWTKDSVAPFIPRYRRCAGRMLRAMYEAQFDAQIDLQAVHHFGDKHPQYYEHDVEALAQLIGPIRIIHISRHPVDVVNSMLRRSRNAQRGQDTWSLTRTIEDGCQHWARAWNAANVLSTRYGTRFTHVKYEDCLNATALCMQQLADALGVEDKFETSSIVPEDPEARDLVTASDIDRINGLLRGLPSRWSEPLETLGAEFAVLP